MKDDKVYLIHIFECIVRIEQYTEGGEGYFFSDTKTQNAVLRNLHILSESTQRLSPMLKVSISNWSGNQSRRHEPEKGQSASKERDR